MVLVVLVIISTVSLAYFNALRVPFVFDDDASITQNQSIRSLTTAFFPPSGSGITVSGRPLLNASFALNYAISGYDPFGYHVVNLLIHICGATVLFLLVRQTLARSAFAEKSAGHLTALAGLTALLWAAHPLQTESVTYVVQRAESLVGLFYLLTLYGFSRFAVNRSRLWFIFTCSACFLGMATKEVMATAPVVVFLYDRAFVSATFSEVWRRHRKLHLILACTWLLLAALILTEHGRGGSVGTSDSVGWLGYVCTQPVAIARYLWLSVWPSDLTFDYGVQIERRLPLVVGCSLLIGAALFFSVYAWSRKPKLNFLGIAFFLILAPSSSIVPVVTQTMAEHRMYLPLAIPVLFFVLGAYLRLRRVGLLVSAAVVPLFVFLTVSRNHDYRSAYALWSDTAEKAPTNERAHNNIGVALTGVPEKSAEAIAHYKRSLQLNPNYALAHHNLGMLLAPMPGHSEEAMEHFYQELRLKPNEAGAHLCLGNLLAQIPGRETEALGHFDAALKIDPKFAEAHNNRATLLWHAFHDVQGAIAEYTTALALNPDYAEAHNNLGNAQLSAGSDVSIAVLHFREALRLKPHYSEAYNSLGNALAMQPDHLVEAVSAFETALKENPNFAEAQSNLANLLLRIPSRREEALRLYQSAVLLNPGKAEIRLNFGKALSLFPERLAEAVTQLEAALQIDPANAEAHYLLGNAFLAEPARLPEAVVQLKAAVEGNPGYAQAHNNLGIALARSGKLDEARAEFEAALRCRPDFGEAQQNLAMVRQLLASQPK